MPIAPHTSYRPIDATLAQLRERQAVISTIDREAIEMVSRDPSAALRLTLLASELRREIVAEVSL